MSDGDFDNVLSPISNLLLIFILTSIALFLSLLFESLRNGLVTWDRNVLGKLFQRTLFYSFLLSCVNRVRLAKEGKRFHFNLIKKNTH